MNPIKSAGMLLTGLKVLTRIAYSLRGIHRELARVADALEGVTPPRDLPEAEEPVEVVQQTNYADAYQVESRLRATLKRDPTPDEVLAELDGEEMAFDLDAHVGKRRGRVN